MSILLHQIDSFLQSEDIEGFIAQGAPNDEYYSEAKMITEAISALPSDQISEQDILSLIAIIWMKIFDLSQDDLLLRKSHFENVVRKILTSDVRV